MGLGRPQRAGYFADRRVAGAIHAMERQQHVGGARRSEHAFHVVARRVLPLAAAHRRGDGPLGVRLLRRLARRVGLRAGGRRRARGRWLAHWLYAKSAERLHREAQTARWESTAEISTKWIAKRLDYLCRRDCEALDSLSGLVSGEALPPLSTKIASLQQRLTSLKRDMLAGGV